MLTEQDFAAWVARNWLSEVAQAAIAYIRFGTVAAGRWRAQQCRWTLSQQKDGCHNPV